MTNKLNNIYYYISIYLLINNIIQKMDYLNIYFLIYLYIINEFKY